MQKMIEDWDGIAFVTTLYRDTGENFVSSCFFFLLFSMKEEIIGIGILVFCQSGLMLSAYCHKGACDAF